MKYNRAYLDFLYYFHGPYDFFECHEILEEHWKKDEACNRKKYWVGLIQLAVSFYHYRRKNFSGASKTIKKSIFILEQEQERIEQLGLNSTQLINELERVEQNILSRVPYRNIQLPFCDSSLQKFCAHQCSINGYDFFGTDPCLPYIVNKHYLRDRTSIIKERIDQQSKNKKMNP